MSMKKCCMCKVVYEGSQKNYCGPCWTIYAHEWYEKNKEELKRRANDRNKVRRERVRSLLRSAKSKPCTDCGVEYPYYIMQFDHLRDKKFTISRVISGDYRSDIDIISEIKKCDVVCANCHAERTYRRRHHGDD